MEQQNREIVAVDMDGTLCVSGNYTDWLTKPPTYWKKVMSELPPIQKTIDFVNKKYDEGAEVYIFTARDDIYTKMTKDWLKKHKVKFHWVQMKKPYYDIFIDDKVMRPEEIE